MLRNPLSSFICRVFPTVCVSVCVFKHLTNFCVGKVYPNMCECVCVFGKGLGGGNGAGHSKQAIATH